MAVLGAALVVYDVVATSLLPLTNDLTDQLAGLPFAPQITWASGDNQWLGVGLGDQLLAAVFPIVMRNAFRRTAGLLALLLGLLTLAAMLVLLVLRLAQVTLPAMVALGPLMVAQNLFWTRRLGHSWSIGSSLRNVIVTGTPAGTVTTSGSKCE